MRRVVPLLLIACLGFAPAPVPRVRPIPRPLTGKWAVTFSNGVVQTCELQTDGSACVVEAARSSEGIAATTGKAVVITYRDDRVERWSVRGTGVVVEHWFPASRYPTGSRVLGTARRVP